MARVPSQRRGPRRTRAPERLAASATYATSSAFQIIRDNHDIRTAEAVFLDKWATRSEPGVTDVRDFTWGYLKNLGHRELLTIRTGYRKDGRPYELYQAEFSPDGTKLISAGQDGTATICDAATGQCLDVLDHHGTEVNAAVFSPCGKLAATASDDGVIRLWNIAARSVIHGMKHAEGSEAVCVVFTPDGQRLVSGGRDACLVIWDRASGALLGRFAAGVDQIENLAIERSGRFAVAGGGSKRYAMLDLARPIPFERFPSRASARNRSPPFHPMVTRLPLAPIETSS